MPGKHRAYFGALLNAPFTEYEDKYTVQHPKNYTLGLGCIMFCCD